METSFTPFASLSGGILIGLAAVCLMLMGPWIYVVLTGGLPTVDVPAKTPLLFLGGALVGPRLAFVMGVAAVFGVGWGIAGLLPAGALPALGTLDGHVIIFVGALIAGMPATRGVTHWAKPRAQPAE